jgi:hypothetical protein
MANQKEMTAEDEATLEASWVQWLASRPQVIKDLGARFKPWKLYRMKSTGHRVFCLSFSENNTITVAVTGTYNLLSMERQVFGIEPDDLLECDLPGPEEVVGVYLTEDEQLLMVNRRRAEFGLPNLTLEEFQNMGDKPYCMVDGQPAGEPIDRDVPPPEGTT